MKFKNLILQAICLFVCPILLTSCAIATGMNKKIFPTDVYWDNQQAPAPHQVLEALSLQEERYYDGQNVRKDLLIHYGVMPKGYNYDEKEILVYQLSKKARDMGADALINVRYSLQVGQKTYGYYISGLAVKLPQQNIKVKKKK